MITFTTGNLLESDAEALVNTVNTVGIMGKGIALMFKDAFPDNFSRYAAACKENKVTIGSMFITARSNLFGPKWIINFPTKKHWRNPSKIEWVEAGLKDLRRIIQQEQIKSIAIPPLGSGNGGLDWQEIKPLIIRYLSDLPELNVKIFEPSSEYRNISKAVGIEQLTPARALIVELLRRYQVLGFDCTLLEIQKLAWFLERAISQLDINNPLDLQFEANIYGPYAKRLRHLLDALDGSYLHCKKRISDAAPLDTISFDQSKKDTLNNYLATDECKVFNQALDATSNLIEGFESPLGMEALATIDWLMVNEKCAPELDAIKTGLESWSGGKSAAQRKLRLFSDALIILVLQQLTLWNPSTVQTS